MENAGHKELAIAKVDYDPKNNNRMMMIDKIPANYRNI
jgi:hypothetical protein